MALRILMMGAPKGGKCLGPNVPVLMFDGSIKLAKDVKAGDKLMGMDSTPRNVLKTHSGTSPMYLVKPNKSDPWVCTDDHIMTVSYNGRIKDIRLNDLLTMGETNKEGWTRYKLFHVPVEFPEVETPIDPYLMGVWLGDGTYKRVEITTPDMEIHEYIHSLDYGQGISAKLVQPKDSTKCVSTTITLEHNLGKLGIGKNPILNEIRRVTESGEKRIASEYLINSRNSRMQTLAGLLDTDGYLGNGYYEITTKYFGMAKDIEFLARSLGFNVSKREHKVAGYPDNTYFRIHIMGDIQLIPLKVLRKKAKKSYTGRNSLVEGFGVESLGVGEFYGFWVDGDNRFLLGDFTVTHNTGSLASAANAGWNIRYLDFDGNPDPLIAYTEKSKRTNLHIVSCLDEYKMVRQAGKNGNVFDEVFKFDKEGPKAWKTMHDALDKWPTDGSNPREWDPTKNLLVLDSLTTIAQSKVQLVQYTDGREGKRKNFSDYEQTQTAVENLVKTLKIYVQCPVIVMSHLQLISANLDIPDEEEITDADTRNKLLQEKIKLASKTPVAYGPVTMGKAQVNTLAAHFNGAVLVEANPMLGRKIHIAPREGLNLGLPFPSIAGKNPPPKELPLESGIKAILDAWLESR